MNKNKLNNVTEASEPGLKVTKKAQDISKKENDSYYKDVEKKMEDYNKEITDDENFEEPKTNHSDSEKEYHDEMEIRNGQEMIQYDREPDEKFKDRAKKAIEGDSTMGNKTYTGDENGNTEPVWGASDADFGKKLTKTAKDSHKKRQDATPTLNQFGDDIEAGEGKPKIVNRKIATEGLKRITFKKPFDGVANALKRIPKSFQVESKKFELTDGNENYLIEWKGGKANILKASDKNMLSEDYAKIKHLMGYNSKSTLGTLDGRARVNENARLASGFAQGNGFKSEGDIESDFDWSYVKLDNKREISPEEKAEYLKKLAKWKEDYKDASDMERHMMKPTPPNAFRANNESAARIDDDGRVNELSPKTKLGGPGAS